MTFVVLQVSDTHLSATHAYFTDNWQVFVDEVRALAPDLVINTGDFSFNGPAVVEDLAFSHAEAELLGVPYLAVPGNHDVGEPGDNPRLKQPVNDARLANWKRYFGDDRFVRDIESWRLIGINGELLGSGLPAEEDQWAFLETSLREAAGRSLGLFTHKPLFATEPDEVASKWSTLPEPRARLIEIAEGSQCSFCRVRPSAPVSLHQSRRNRFGLVPDHRLHHTQPKGRRLYSAGRLSQVGFRWRRRSPQIRRTRRVHESRYDLEDEEERYHHRPSGKTSGGAIVRLSFIPPS